MSFYKDVWTLRIFVFHVFRPSKWELFSLPAHAGSHLRPLHLAELCVGLQGARLSLQPKPSFACLEWLTLICSALVDHCPILHDRGLQLGAKCLHLSELWWSLTCHFSVNLCVKPLSVESLSQQRKNLCIFVTCFRKLLLYVCNSSYCICETKV